MRTSRKGTPCGRALSARLPDPALGVIFRRHASDPFSYRHRFPKPIYRGWPSLRRSIPLPMRVHDDDDAAVVDFNVVGHVGVVGSGRYIERRLLGSLRVADVPRAHAGVEVSSERQLAIVRIAEVLFGRMGAEALATQAVVAARVFLTRLRIDPQRR